MAGSGFTVTPTPPMVWAGHGQRTSPAISADAHCRLYLRRRWYATAARKCRWKACQSNMDPSERKADSDSDQPRADGNRPRYASRQRRHAARISRSCASPHLSCSVRRGRLRCSKKSYLPHSSPTARHPTPPVRRNRMTPAPDPPGSPALDNPGPTRMPSAAALVSTPLSARAWWPACVMLLLLVERLGASCGRRGRGRRRGGFRVRGWRWWRARRRSAGRWW